MMMMTVFFTPGGVLPSPGDLSFLPPPATYTPPIFLHATAPVTHSLSHWHLKIFTPLPFARWTSPSVEYCRNAILQRSIGQQWSIALRCIALHQGKWRSAKPCPHSIEAERKRSLLTKKEGRQGRRRKKVAIFNLQSAIAIIEMHNCACIEVAPKTLQRD